jgi:hypothetical protein
LDWIITTSDSNGYYEIYLEDIFNGEFVLFFSAESYYSTSAWPLPLREHSLIWINASLNPGAPAKNSKICGYILDAETLEPIQGAFVNVHWKDYKGHGDYLDTYSDSSGFYSVDIAAGGIYSWGNADGYFASYGNAEFIKDGKTG